MILVDLYFSKVSGGNMKRIDRVGRQTDDR